MSKLYLSETGRVIPELGEDLTTFRRARKQLDLPATSEPATLYCLAHSYGGNSAPLRLAINGAEVSPRGLAAASHLTPDASDPTGNGGGYRWLRVEAPSHLLKAGANTFEFWTDGTAMNTWALALEPGHADPGSFVSDDGGASWRNHHMCSLSAVRGEYVVRVRLAEGEDPAPPEMIWEDPQNPRLAHLREILPADALGAAPLMQRVRALTGWISASWEHTNSSRGTQYAPWDAETILAWGRSRSGHNARIPIVMCVHYSVAFATCCQAAGIPARCVISTNEVNGDAGHFVAEVWFPEHRKWVLVDPNLDALFQEDGVPLATPEVQEASRDLERLVVWGSGTGYQRQFAHIREFISDNYLRGHWIKHYSIWPRADFLSHPEFSPPGHGSVAYCETGMVWRSAELQQFGMFPYRGEAGYFAVPPQAFPAASAGASSRRDIGATRSLLMPLSGRSGPEKEY